MKTLTISLITITLLISCGSDSGIDWSGTYKYNEVAGPGMGGEPREYEYIITIQKASDDYTANYDIDGYQTMSRAVCTAKEEDGKLALYFVSYGDDHMGPGYDEGSKILTISQGEGAKYKVEEGGDTYEYLKEGAE